MIKVNHKGLTIPTFEHGELVKVLAIYQDEFTLCNWSALHLRRFNGSIEIEQ